MGKLKINNYLFKLNCINFLFYLFVFLSFESKSFAVLSCKKLLSETPLSLSKIILNTPDVSLKNALKSRKRHLLLHGTSSHTMVDAIKKSGIRGREVVYFPAATDAYPELLEKKTRVLYTYFITEDVLLNSDASLLEDTIQSSIIYAGINADESTFFDHFGLSQDLITHNVQSFIKDLVFPYGEEEYSDFLAEFQNSTGSDREAFEYVKSIIGPYEDDEFSEKIKTLMRFKGVIVVFKNTSDLDDTIVPDPETADENGHILLTEAKNFDLNQVEALYPLSWADYNLLFESLSSLKP